MWPSTICHLSTRADSCTIFVPSLTCECYTSGREGTLAFWHSHERPGFCSAECGPALLALHAAQCAAILKLGCFNIAFPRKASLTICQTVGRQCKCMSWIPSSSPLSLLSALGIDIFALELWFCPLETSSWRLSQMSSCGEGSYDSRGTLWNKTGRRKLKWAKCGCQSRKPRTVRVTG